MEDKLFNWIYKNIIFWKFRTVPKNFSLDIKSEQEFLNPMYHWPQEARKKLTTKISEPELMHLNQLFSEDNLEKVAWCSFI